MNVDVDFSAVSKLVRGLLKELREKRLWPVAVVLLVAIVAVPFVLSKSSAATPIAAMPQATPAGGAGTSLPALSVQTTPSQSRLTGRGRDPFAKQSAGKSSVTSPKASAAVAGSTTTVPGAGGGAGTAPLASHTGSSTATLPSRASSGTPAPKPITPPNATATPSPSGLSATQSYHVSLAITNPAGGVDTIDPLVRLTVLPSEQQPDLVELGVMQGGRRVLFVVQPGTVVNGPGICTPGPIDCELLSLGQDQTESISTQSPTGLVPGPLFAVTAITADQHSSAAAATRARTAESAAGRDLLGRSTLGSLPLFQYQPSLGAVVDLRNLTVSGGN